jgi:lipase chaperone LimK
MTSSSLDQSVLVRYLLDASSDEEKVRVEQEFFGSDEAFGRLCEIEDELLTIYQQGRLTAEERAIILQALGRGVHGSEQERAHALQSVMLKRWAT